MVLRPGWNGVQTRLAPEIADTINQPFHMLRRGGFVDTMAQIEDETAMTKGLQNIVCGPIQHLSLIHI